MARVKLAITKSVLFQGRTEEFSNVYTYDGVTVGDDAQLNALADAVVTREKAIHSSAVSFLKAQIWSVGIGINYMYLSKALTGFGSAANSTGMYRECAILCRWPLPRSTVLTKAARRDLRKFLHTCSDHSYTITGGNSSATGPRDNLAINTYMDAVAAPITGVKLVAPNGDEPTGQGTTAGWLEHRQFPRGRKRNT